MIMKVSSVRCLRGGGSCDGAASESQGPMLIHVDSPKVPRNDTRLFFTDFKKIRGHHVGLKK